MDETDDSSIVSKAPNHTYDKMTVCKHFFKIKLKFLNYQFIVITGHLILPFIMFSFAFIY